MKITPEELLKDGVKRRIDAYFYPKNTPKLAIKIIDFLQRNARRCLCLAGGMSHHVIGLDIDKLTRIAEKQNINLGRYMFAVELYESKMLDKQELDNKQRSNQ